MTVIHRADRPYGIGSLTADKYFLCSAFIAHAAVYDFPEILGGNPPCIAVVAVHVSDIFAFLQGKAFGIHRHDSACPPVIRRNVRTFVYRPQNLL